MTDFAALAEEFGTPFYHYDLAAPGLRAGELFDLFPSAGRSRLLYSFKSNPLPSLAGAIQEAGCEADLTAPGELEAARLAGFPIDRALYGGPGKDQTELAGAIASGVRQFSLESFRDYEAAGEAASEANVLVRGLLRVNPAEPPRAKLVMSGVASQFGFEEEDLLSRGRGAFGRFAEHVAIEGIHIYWGTQIGGVEELAHCFRHTVATAERITEHLGIPLKVLNLGGGFPWPYAKHGSAESLLPLKDELAVLHESAGTARDAEWWFESGRYLSASSGTLVSRVMDLKKSKDRSYLILDTGIHHLGGMAGLGRIPRFAVDLVCPPGRTGSMRKVDIVGQLCTPLDCIGRNQLIPGNLSPGDLVAIPNVGAYGVTGSLTGFLSRPAPAEIATRDGAVVAAHRWRGGHAPEPISTSP